jgi:hypothetical protein
MSTYSAVTESTETTETTTSDNSLDSLSRRLPSFLPHGEVHERVQRCNSHSDYAQPEEALRRAQARIREENGLVQRSACSSSSSSERRSL